MSESHTTDPLIIGIVRNLDATLRQLSAPQQRELLLDVRARIEERMEGHAPRCAGRQRHMRREDAENSRRKASGAHRMVVRECGACDGWHVVRD